MGCFKNFGRNLKVHIKLTLQEYKTLVLLRNGYLNLNTIYIWCIMEWLYIQ